jgi:DNA-binding CsgD family transcriptional regulator
VHDPTASVERGCQLSYKWRNVNLQAACLALTAQLELAQGTLEKAQTTAVTLEELIRDHPLSHYWSMWVWTEFARFWMELGKTEKALLLIRDTGILPYSFTPETLSLTSTSKDVSIPYRLAPAYMILARLSLKIGSPDAALAISECLMQEASAWGWGKLVTELFILKALAFQAKKDTAASLAAFGKAIASAWPEQSKRVFLDEGVAMGKLLYQAKAHGIGGEFVTDLLSIMDQQAQLTQPVTADLYVIDPSKKTSAQMESGQGQRLLVEPLSAREMEVLRCIAEGYSNQEIADRFVLSPLTVKRHISNIYAKLEAKNRTQAVALARTLKLIE